VCSLQGRPASEPQLVENMLCYNSDSASLIYLPLRDIFLRYLLCTDIVKNKSRNRIFKIYYIREIIFAMTCEHSAKR
jgi:hypothetical protein